MPDPIVLPNVNFDLRNAVFAPKPASEPIVRRPEQTFERDRLNFQAPREQPVLSLRGLKYQEDLGDGWRFEASATPRRRGTVSVGIRRTF
jgi:hypothetical protein